MDNKLVKYLKDNSTIITPSRRLASSLQSQAQGYFGQNARVWPTPSIFALQDWLESLWQQLEIQGVLTLQLLSSTQSLLVWTSLIRKVPIGNKLLNVSITAKMAAAAWGLLQQYPEANTLWHEADTNLDQDTFKEFAKVYEEWLREHNAIDSQQLISQIQPYLTDDYREAWQRVSPVKLLVFYGFEEITPQLQQLHNTLQQQDWSVTQLLPVQKPQVKVARKDFYDHEQEFLAASLFAKKRLSEGKKNIGIVVPELADQRSLVEKTLKAVFTPLALCEPQATVCEEYNISAAIPLDHYPIIHSAFAFLKMVSGTFTLPEYLQIISAPFFAWELNELTVLLQHYETLKAMSVRTLSLKTLSRSMPSCQSKKIVEEIATAVAMWPKKNPYATWANQFQTILELADWPGRRALNSIEHQAVARLFEALAQLRLIDTVLSPCRFNEALSVLRGIVSKIPFQPQSKGASVQVLGVLEALGLQFDCVWVTGLHSEAWPSLAKPNPFIPLSIQSQLKMPHANAMREMDYAKTMTQRLLTCAEEVILSYPLRDKAKSLDASELIRHIPLLEEELVESLIAHERLESRFTHAPKLEKVDAREMIPLQESEKIAATTKLLTLQAACPFKAFAEIRLDAVAFQVQEDWLAPHQQGIILHELLQHFWQQTKTHEALQRIDEQALSALLVDLIDRVLQKHIKPNIPLPYLHVEKNRLLLILKEYLTIEKTRQPFSVVANEISKSFYLRGMHFKVRLDRIDKTHDDQTLLIDYKTGEFNITGIWGDRPRAPQLPLYYLAAFDEDPKGLLVAKLNRQALCYEGISNNVLGIDGVEVPKYPAWQELKTYWESTLGNLVASFQKGDISVDPLDSTTCRHCDLQAFCRINENES